MQAAELCSSTCVAAYAACVCCSIRVDAMDSSVSAFLCEPLLLTCRYFSPEELEQFVAQAKQRGLRSDSVSVLDSIFGPASEHGRLIRSVSG
jgi:hypothetical protein